MFRALRACNKLIIKQDLCVTLVNYWHYCEKRLLASSCLSTCMQQRDSHWADFHEIQRFFENPSRRFDLDYYIRIKGTVRENLCTFSIVSR